MQNLTLEKVLHNPDGQYAT
ncbi:hypothetical protein KGM_203461A, partial [Danaus plexippus plexippus]